MRGHGGSGTRKPGAAACGVDGDLSVHCAEGTLVGVGKVGGKLHLKMPLVTRTTVGTPSGLVCVSPWGRPGLGLPAHRPLLQSLTTSTNELVRDSGWACCAGEGYG